MFKVLVTYSVPYPQDATLWGKELEMSMLDQRIDYQIQINNVGKDWDEVKAGDINHPSLFGRITDYNKALKKLDAIRKHNRGREYRLIKTTTTLEVVDENQV